MEIKSAVKLAVGIMHGIAVLCCLGAVVYVGWRFYQIRSRESVSALVLRAGPSESMVSTTDSEGYTTVSPMYTAEALVRYDFRGQEYTAVARHDVAVSSRSFQERLTREWKPGTRIQVLIDPSKPDRPLAGMAMNWNTFSPVLLLLAFGALISGAGYGLQRLMDFVLSGAFRQGGILGR